jgi:hypothetical protein
VREREKQRNEIGIRVHRAAATFLILRSPRVAVGLQRTAEIGRWPTQAEIGPGGRVNSRPRPRLGPGARSVCAGGCPWAGLTMGRRFNDLTEKKKGGPKADWAASAQRPRLGQNRNRN